MRTLIAAALFFGLSVLGASAQTADPEAVPPSANPEAAQGGSMKELFQQCRVKAKSQGLRGKAQIQPAVDACVVSARPEMARRVKCREQGVEKGLTGEQLRGYIKTCLASPT